MNVHRLFRAVTNQALPAVAQEYWINRRWVASIRRTYSHLDARFARPYTDYWSDCKRRSPVAETLTRGIVDAVETLNNRGYAWFDTEETRRLAASMVDRVREEEANGLPWNEDASHTQRYAAGDIYQRFPEIVALIRGDFGRFLRAFYGTHFKIYYGIMYRSLYGDGTRTGSQLWHADGGPGTCLNVHFFLTETAADNGAMEFVPWGRTVDIFSRERGAMKRIVAGVEAAGSDAIDHRTLKCDWLEREIGRRHARAVERATGPAGTVLAFRNNVIHRGGFVPAPGRSRYTCLFHCYPSDRPTPYDVYRERGIGKRGAYPDDPAEI